MPDGSAPDLLEQGELPVFGLGHGYRVAAGEARGAVTLALGVVHGLQETLVRKVRERVRADAAADLVHRVRRGDQLALGGGVDPVVTGAGGGRAADPQV